MDRNPRLTLSTQSALTWQVGPPSSDMAKKIHVAPTWYPCQHTSHRLYQPHVALRGPMKWFHVDQSDGAMWNPVSVQIGLKISSDQT